MIIRKEFYKIFDLKRENVETCGGAFLLSNCGPLVIKKCIKCFELFVRDARPCVSTGYNYGMTNSFLLQIDTG